MFYVLIMSFYTKGYYINLFYIIINLRVNLFYTIKYLCDIQRLMC